MNVLALWKPIVARRGARLRRRQRVSAAGRRPVRGGGEAAGRASPGGRRAVRGVLASARLRRHKRRRDDRRPRRAADRRRPGRRATAARPRDCARRGDRARGPEFERRDRARGDRRSGSSGADRERRRRGVRLRALRNVPGRVEPRDRAVARGASEHPCLGAGRPARRPAGCAPDRVEGAAGRARSDGARRGERRRTRPRRLASDRSRFSAWRCSARSLSAWLSRPSWPPAGGRPAARPQTIRSRSERRCSANGCEQSRSASARSSRARRRSPDAFGAVTERESALATRGTALTERVRAVTERERAVAARGRLSSPRVSASSSATWSYSLPAEPLRPSRSRSRSLERGVPIRLGRGTSSPSSGSWPSAGSEFPERLEEWQAYLFFLREHASLEGVLPPSFDALVDEAFHELVG